MYLYWIYRIYDVYIYMFVDLYLIYNIYMIYIVQVFIHIATICFTFFRSPNRVSEQLFERPWKPCITVLVKTELITLLERIQCGAASPKISTGWMKKEPFRCYFKCSKTSEIKNFCETNRRFCYRKFCISGRRCCIWAWLNIRIYQDSVLVK